MRGAILSLLLGGGLLFACGDDDPTTTSEADASAAIDASTGGCTSDDDCRRFSSFCEGCECLPLLESEADPVCEGMMVDCLLDPCDAAGAVRCDVATGACELE